MIFTQLKRRESVKIASVKEIKILEFITLIIYEFLAFTTVQIIHNNLNRIIFSPVISL